MVNVITGTDEADFLEGSNQDDEAHGLGGDDIIWTYKQSDTLYGDDGNDKLGGGKGDDTLYGGAGDDFLAGGLDDSNGQGNDLLYGGDGSDKIYASLGDDLLVGGAGKDYLTGQGGADIFKFSAGDSGLLAATRDIIRDFEQGTDKIDVGDAVLVSQKINGLSTFLSFDFDHNGAVDSVVQVKGQMTFTESDFLTHS